MSNYDNLVVFIKGVVVKILEKNYILKNFNKKEK